MPARTKLATVVAKQEGFGLHGVIPTLRHNPGDLRHSPHSQHPGGPTHSEDIGSIDTDEHGWDDLERQLGMYAAMGLTLAEMVNIYCGLPARPAPGAVAPDRNDVPVYLHAVTSGMGMGANTLVSEALKVAA